jgi:hypothetical protein
MLIIVPVDDDYQLIVVKLKKKAIKRFNLTIYVCVSQFRNTTLLLFGLF